MRVQRGEVSTHRIPGEVKICESECSDECMQPFALCRQPVILAGLPVRLAESRQIRRDNAIPFGQVSRKPSPGIFVGAKAVQQENGLAIGGSADEVVPGFTIDLDTGRQKPCAVTLDTDGEFGCRSWKRECH